MLFVQFESHRPIKIVHRSVPGGSEIGTLNDYLKRGGSEHLFFRSRNSDLVYWNKGVIKPDSHTALVLYKVLHEIKDHKEMPKTLDPNILKELGTPTMAKFEEAVFNLISTNYYHSMAEDI